jgi:hypothetical protein
MRARNVARLGDEKYIGLHSCVATPWHRENHNIKTDLKEIW